VILPSPPLNARLAGLPDGFLVVVAGSTPRWPLLDAIDAGDHAPRSGRGVVVALKGVGPVAVTPPDFEGAVTIARGQSLGHSGATAAMDLHVEVRGLEATIDVDGQRVVRATGGLAVAEMGSRLWDTYVLTPGDGLRPPFNMSRRPLFQVTPAADADCTEIGEGRWARLADPGTTGRLVGRVDNFHPFDAEWVAYLAADYGLHPRIVSWFGPNEPALDVEAFEPRRDGDRLLSRLAEDGLEASPELMSAPVVTRVEVKVNDEGQLSVFRLSLGGRPTAGQARATTDRQGIGRATSCVLEPDLLEPKERTQRASLYLGPGGDWLFGAGWQRPEPMPVGFQRVLLGDGLLLLPVRHPALITIRMSVESIGGEAAVAVSLNEGAEVQAPRLATPGWQELWWTLDTSQWRAGLNELTIEVRRPAGRAPAADEPSVRVRAIELDWSAPH
jgi:hypothetical protein